MRSDMSMRADMLIIEPFRTHLHMPPPVMFVLQLINYFAISIRTHIEIGIMCAQLSSTSIKYKSPIFLGSIPIFAGSHRFLMRSPSFGAPPLDLHRASHRFPGPGWWISLNRWWEPERNHRWVIVDEAINEAIVDLWYCSLLDIQHRKQFFFTSFENGHGYETRALDIEQHCSSTVGIHYWYNQGTLGSEASTMKRKRLAISGSKQPFNKGTTMLTSRRTPAHLALW